MKAIKIFGLKRTCTNYISALLRNNFKKVLVFTNILGWKHGPPVLTYDGSTWDEDCKPNGKGVQPEIDEYQVSPEILSEDSLRALDVKYICVYKDIFAWLHSLATFTNANLNDPAWYILQARLWCERQTQYEELFAAHPEDVLIIKHDELLVGFEGVLDVVKLQFRLEAKHNEYQNIEAQLNRNGPFKGEHTPEGVNFKRKWYLTGGYMEAFHEPTIKGVTEEITQHMKGYETCVRRSSG